MRRVARALVALCCVMFLAACNVRVHATIRVNADGTGHVRALVELDRQATTLAKRDGGSLDGAVRLDDLKRAGWTIGPWRERDGSASITVERDTKSPGDTQAAIEDLGGGTDGVLSDVSVKVDAGSLSTDTKVSYSVDLTKLKLTDAESIAKLKFVGVDAKAVTDLAAHRSKNAVTLEISTDLPVDDPVTDTFPWGDARTVTRDTTEYHLGSAAMILGGGVLAVVGLAGFAASRKVRHS
ncbi:MAG: hypothetical protein WBD02_10175 [Acidimicrobiia bacterium]